MADDEERGRAKVLLRVFAGGVRVAVLPAVAILVLASLVTTFLEAFPSATAPDPGARQPSADSGGNKGTIIAVIAVVVVAGLVIAVMLKRAGHDARRSALENAWLRPPDGWRPDPRGGLAFMGTQPTTDQRPVPYPLQVASMICGMVTPFAGVVLAIIAL
jgi:hypothetical protein